MKTFTRNILLVLITLLIAQIVSGCNTLQGVGRDIQQAGYAVEDAADQ